MTSATNAPENLNGQSQAAASAGNEEDGLNGIASPAYSQTLDDDTESSKSDTKDGKSGEDQKTQTEATATQPTEKDQRHASRKIQQDFEQKLRLAKRLVSKDPEAIYDIAEEDETLATHILKTDASFGAKTVAELREKKDLDGDANDQRFKSTDKKLSRLEQQLMEERLLRMKIKHPDLKGELEQKYRELYSDERFSDLSENDPEKLVSVARALTGTAQTSTPNVSDVAMDLLRSQEGALPSGGGGASPSEKQKLSASQKARLSQFGHSESDLAKYLPSNIDEILGIS